MIEPLAPQLTSYFYFHGMKGALLMQLGRNEEAHAALTRAIAAREHGDGSGSYPNAPGPPNQRRRIGRRSQNIEIALKNSSIAVGAPFPDSSLR